MTSEIPGDPPVTEQAHHMLSWLYAHTAGMNSVDARNEEVLASCAALHFMICATASMFRNFDKELMLTQELYDEYPAFAEHFMPKIQAVLDSAWPVLLERMRKEIG